MIEKRFKVYAEEYQDTDDMGYAIAPPVIYYHAGNSKMGFNFDTEKEAKRLCEAWNKLVEEDEQSKMMITTLRNIVLEQEDLEKENKELKAFKETVFEWIDGEIDSVKESCNVLMTSDEAEAVMDTLIELKNELSGEKNE